MLVEYNSTISDDHDKIGCMMENTRRGEIIGGKGVGVEGKIGSAFWITIVEIMSKIMRII